MGQLDEARNAIGMSPASDDDLGELVAFLVLFELLRKEVSDECDKCPPDERGNFMLTYAAYIKWVVLLAVEAKFQEEAYNYAYSLIDRELAKQPWYNEAKVESLYDQMVEFPPLERSGTFNSIVPWAGAVVAASSLGMKLTPSVDMQFHIYVCVITKQLLETMSKAKPA